jgi:hypothetical protein
MGQFSMKICPQVDQFLMELNNPATAFVKLLATGTAAETSVATGRTLRPFRNLHRVTL